MFGANSEFCLRSRPHPLDDTRSRARPIVRGYKVHANIMKIFMLISVLALTRAEIFLRDVSEPSKFFFSHCYDMILLLPDNIYCLLTSLYLIAIQLAATTFLRDFHFKSTRRISVFRISTLIST